MTTALPEGFGTFTNEQIAAGQIGTGQQSYLAQFKYTVRLDNGSKKLVLYKLDEKVQEFESLDIVIYHAHQVWRLRKGSTQGLQGNTNKWPEDAQQLVAQTYDSPFSNKEGCRGNFDPTYSIYLDDRDHRKKVQKRIYVFFGIPDIIPQGEVVVGSFGFSIHDSLTSVSKSLDSDHNLPTSAVNVRMAVENATNADNESYARPAFALIWDGDKLSMSVKSVEEHQSLVAPVTAKVRRLHTAALAQPQQAQQIPAPVPQQIPAPAQALPEGFEHDDIPF